MLLGVWLHISTSSQIIMNIVKIVRVQTAKLRSHSLKNIFLQKLGPLGAKKVGSAEKYRYRTQTMLLGV